METKGLHLAEHAVVIAEGGPTGMMLAAELALAGIEVLIVEQHASQEFDGSPPAVSEALIKWFGPPTAA